MKSLVTRSVGFPNPRSIKRPHYLPELVTRQDKEEWDHQVTLRYNLLTTDVQVNGKIITSPYNKALGGCNQKSIPDLDWANIVDHCLWVACFTYDRDKIANIQKYNETAERPIRVPKSVCPLPNYFWKLIYFTSCTWYKKYSDSLGNCSLDDTRMI